MLLCEKPYFFEYREDFHSEKQKKCDRTLFRCGKCFACKMQRSTDWKNRIILEANSYGFDNCLFLTLTFSDNSLSERGHCFLDKRDIQLFLKRLRISAKRVLGIENIRYYAAGEYGSRTSRPHYHLILFGLRNNELVRGLITSCWNFGFCHFGSFSANSASYVAGYCAKQEISKVESRSSDKLPEWHLQSLGLGRDFVNSLLLGFKEGDLDVPRFIRFGGRIMFLPLYLVKKAREKVFSSDYIDSLKLALLLNYKSDFSSRLSLNIYQECHPDSVLERYLSFVNQKIANLKSIYKNSYLRRQSCGGLNLV